MTFRFFCLALLIYSCVSATAGGCSGSKETGDNDGALDTRRLPRAEEVREVFASPASTIYLARESVEKTIAQVGQKFAEAGWQPYASPVAAQADKVNMRIASYKRQSQAVTVFITVAPAQRRQASVQYAAVKLPFDLPFPPDGTNIEYDPNRPQLSCLTAQPVEKSLEHFDVELARLGWSVWLPKPGATRVKDGTATAYYVRDGAAPLELKLTHGEDDMTQVTIKSVPAETLIKESEEP
ncbi:MAG TPA: hypothetical protein VGN12_02140 [Pirellulales bacterium]|jgi:hypothetical protein